MEFKIAELEEVTAAVDWAAVYSGSVVKTKI